MLSIKRLLGAAIVVLVSGSVAAAPAQAGLLGSVGSVVGSTTTTLSDTTTGVVGQVLPPPVTQAVNVIPAGYDPITPLEELLGGQVGIGTVLEQALCKPVTEVSELAAQLGLNPIGDGLTTLACSTSVLEYRFHTRFRRSNGSNLERAHVAHLGVPTLLDVDEDTGADLIGTITLTGVNTVGLTIDRVPGEAATLPVSVEAILRDPDGSLLGREHLAFGYDARDDRAPGRFVMATPADTVLQPQPDFQLTVSQQGRGERIALIGGLFDGTPVTRLNPAEIRLDYHASPDEATLRAKVGDPVTATLTTNRRGLAELSGRIADSATEDRFRATLDQIPSSLTLTADTSGALDVTYGASSRVTKLTGSVERLSLAGATPALLQKAELVLDDVPTGIRVTQTDEGGSVTTTGGPIGRTKVGIANGEPRYLAGEPAYVNLDDDGTLQSVAVELPGLERATFAIGTGVSAGAKLQATPLLARVVEPGRTLQARVDQLPSEFDIAVDPQGGVLEYDGHGTGIDRVTVSADSDTPLFARVTKLRGTLEGIPAQMVATLDTAAGGGGVVVDGTGPIGKVELLASNGPETAVPGDGAGVVYRDLTGGDFVIAGRVFDLRELRFASAPATSLEAVTRGGPFTVDVATDDLDVDGEVLDLPAQATFLLDQEAGKLSFTGADGDGDPQGIDLLTLVASSTGGLIGRADRLDARIEGIPASLDLVLSPGADSVGVTASNPIGSIEVVAADRPIDRTADLPAGTTQGVRYVDRDGEFAVGARVRELTKVAAAMGDELQVEAQTQGGLFTADVLTDDLTAAARIADLPPKAVLTAALNAGRVTFQGRTADDQPAGIAALDVDLEAAQPLFGRARIVDAHLEGIPADLALDIAQDGNGIDVSVQDDAIDLIEVVAANRAPQPDDLPTGGEQGAKLVDLTGGDYVLGARVRELQRLTGTFGGDVLQVHAETAGGPFGVRYVNDELNALARIVDLPDSFTATIDLANGKVSTDGSAPIELLTFDAVGSQPVFGEATNIAARIEGIPQTLMLDLAQTGSGARLVADQPIRLIEVAAANRAVDLDADVPANQGVTFVDDGGQFLLAAKVEELRLLDADLGDDLSVAAKTKGGPFDIVLDTADLDGEAVIRDLPQDVAIALDGAAGKLSYAGKDGDGNPKGIDDLSVSLRGTAAFFDRARRFDLAITKLAPTVTVDLAQGGAGAAINTDQPIESIAFAASDDPARTLADALAFIGDPQGAVFRDTASEYLLAGRVLDLEQLTFGLSGETVSLTSKLRSTPFRVSIASPDLDAGARIADLPEQAQVDLDLDAGSLSYAGKDGNGDPKAIGAITFNADAPASSPLFGAATKLRGRILQVPPNLDIGFSQTGGQATLQTTNGAIGTLEFLATNQGGPETFPTPQGVKFHDRTVGGDREFEVSARVLGLERLVAALGSGLGGGPMVLDAKTAGGLFNLDVATDDFVATGAIDEFPAEAKLQVDLDAPADQDNVRFQGSAPIGLITLDADATSAILGRADKLSVRLADVPQDVGIKLSQTQGRASLASRDSDGNPVAIGSIEVAAWSDSKELPAGGAQGAVYRDVPNGPFRVGARINQLRTLTVDFADDVQLRTQTAGGPFSAVVQTADLTGNVQINDLPSDLDLGVDLDAGRVGYLGNAPIASIVASLESATPLFGNAKAFKAAFTGVPTQFDLVASPSVSNQIALTSTTGVIDKIEVQAGPSLASLPPFAGGANDAGAYADLSGGKFELAARVFKLNTLAVDLEPVKVQAIMESGRRFVVDAKIPSGSQVIDADAVIENLPANVMIELADRADGGSEIRYSASSTINRLYLKATGLTLVPGASDIEAEILGIPTAFALALPGSGPMAILDTGATGNNPGDPAISEVRLRAGSAVTTFPGSSTLDFIKYVDRPGSFGIGARVSGIRYLSAQLSPLALTLGQDTAVNAPIDVEADIQDTASSPLQTIRRSDAAQPVISKPSSLTQIGVTQGARTELQYDGAAGSTLGRIGLRAQNLGGVPLLNLAITDIPSSMDVCFASDLACRATRGSRQGPHRPTAAQDGNNYQPALSLGAVTNHTSGFTTLSGSVNTGDGDIAIGRVKFRNLYLDITQGNTDEGTVDVPRIAIFLDTINTPFVVENVRYDFIKDFDIGTDGDPAAADERFLWIRGASGIFNSNIDRVKSGSLDCGGARRLVTEVIGLDVNLFDVPIVGDLIQLCGSNSKLPSAP